MQIGNQEFLLKPAMWKMFQHIISADAKKIGVWQDRRGSEELTTIVHTQNYGRGFIKMFR